MPFSFSSHQHLEVISVAIEDYNLQSASPIVLYNLCNVLVLMFLLPAKAVLSISMI